MLGRLAELFPDVPRLAVTATADARTRDDIRAELRLEDAREFVDSFARPELVLSAERKRGAGHERVVELVTARPGRSGVVYAGSRDGHREAGRRRCATRASPALAYHAGLDRRVRNERLAQFLAERRGGDGGDHRLRHGHRQAGRALRDPRRSAGLHRGLLAGGRPRRPRRRAGRGDHPLRRRRHELGAAAHRRARHGRRGQAGAGAQGAPALRHARRHRLPRGRGAALFRRGGRRALRPVRPLHSARRSRPTPPRRRRRRSRPRTAWAGAIGRGRLVDHLLGKTKDVSDFEAALSTCGIGRELSRRRLARPDRPAAVRGPAARGPQRRPPAGGPGRRRRRAARSSAASAGCTCADPRRGAGRAAPRKRRASAARRWPSAPADQPLFEALRAWRARRGQAPARAALRDLPRPHPGRDRRACSPAAARPWPRRRRRRRQARRRYGEAVRRAGG